MDNLTHCPVTSTVGAALRSLLGDEVATSTYTYDALGRLTDLEYENGAVDLFTPYEWTYDDLNRITQFVSADGTTDYTYDGTSQLTAADHDYQTDESYTYDDNGNRTGGGYSTGDNNQLLDDGTYDYTYDDEGNRLTRTNDTTDYVTEYEWDHRNRLIRVTEKDDLGATLQVVEYTYDVFNRRIEKAVDTTSPFTMTDAAIERYVYDGDDVVLQFDGDQAGDLTHRYLHGPAVDQILAQEDVSETVSDPDRVLWHLADNLGTVRDLAKNDGSLGEHYEYDSFGAIQSGDTSVTRYLFTGREFDPATGLQYNRARWYDAAVGRWISEDPIGFAADGANLVRYAENSPINQRIESGSQGFVSAVWLAAKTIESAGKAAFAQHEAPSLNAPTAEDIAELERLMVRTYFLHWPEATGGGHNWDWLDYSANFAAGFGDSLSFHTTDLLREWIGINDGIDHDSWTYFSGEAVEITGEIIVTGGGAALRHSAARVSTRTVGAAARREARRIMSPPTGTFVHHVNTLFGHMPIRGGRGSVRSLFPIGGLPRWIQNARPNLCVVDRVTHEALHLRAYRAELAVYYGTLLPLTTTRAMLNMYISSPSQPSEPLPNPALAGGNPLPE